MTTTLAPPAPATAPPPATRPRLDERRLAAVGAIGFATLVIATNVAPGRDARPWTPTPARSSPTSPTIAPRTSFATRRPSPSAPRSCSSSPAAFYGRLQGGRPAPRTWCGPGSGMIGALLILPDLRRRRRQPHRAARRHRRDHRIIRSSSRSCWRFEMAAFLLNTAADRPPRSSASASPAPAPASCRRGSGRWAPVAASCRGRDARPAPWPVSRARPSASAASSRSPRGRRSC